MVTYSSCFVFLFFFCFGEVGAYDAIHQTNAVAAGGDATQSIHSVYARESSEHIETGKHSHKCVCVEGV